MTDQQRYDTVGIFGNRTARTPNLDRLGRSGAAFEEAFTPTPLCVPSRVCYFTGRYCHTNGSRTNLELMRGSEPDLTKTLHDAGYVTALVGKNHCYTPRQLEERLDHRVLYGHAGRRPENPDDPERKVWEYRRGKMYVPYLEDPFPPGVCPTAKITEAALEFLKGQAGAPVFLWLSYPDPHPPYMVTRPYSSMCSPEDVPPPAFEDGEFANKPFRQQFVRRLEDYDVYEGEADIRRLRAIYYGMVSFIDDQFGRIMEELRSTGRLEETIVVFVSDHGDYMGDHKLMRKSPTLYDCLVRVPLIVSWPGQILPRGVAATMISLVDMAPTLLDLAGLAVPHGMQGRSAAEFLRGRTDRHRDRVFLEYGVEGEPFGWCEQAHQALARLRRKGTGHLSHVAMRGRFKAIRTSEWKYVYYPNGEGELYHLGDDPNELRNLFGRPELEPMAARFREEILRWCVETEDVFPPLQPEARVSAAEAENGQ